MAAEVLPEAPACFHCGLPIPPGFRLAAEVAGGPRPMCCVGCCAVAEMLEAQGLSDWYLRRASPAGAPARDLAAAEDALVYLEPGVAEAAYVEREGEALERAVLLVADLRCAACVWVIERHLGALEGIESVRVGLDSHRVEVEWDAGRLGLRDVILRLAEIGFEARPDRPGEGARLERAESRAALLRLGVAGLAAMNVMTYSVALYAGAFEGMAAGYEALMRWLGLVVSTPVVLYSARPFFRGAARDLRLRAPGMDVPVALAIGGAYLVSLYATLRGQGEVFFDSVCMFTFFLGLGRYLELRIRHRAAETTRSLVEARPLVARRQDATGERVVPAHALEVGDRFRVRPGEAVAADGRVLEGRSSVEEALMTGEPWPRAVEPGALVIAGSLNVESPLLVEASRVGGATTLAQIVSLIESAQADRPEVARLADRVAAVFVTGVLGVAALNWLAWQWIDPPRALWTTLAVLVATCPCALGLATPTALAAATRALASSGLLITKARVLEGLVAADRFVFDKTGTLSRGTPMLSRVVPLRDESRDALVAIARRLERDSEHPVARALERAEVGPSRWDRVAGEVRAEPGCGVEAELAGRSFRLGRPDWAARGRPLEQPAEPGEAANVWVLLADEAGPLGWLGLADPLREDVAGALAALRARGLELEMLSGDPSPGALAVANELGLEVDRVGVSPRAKVDRIRELQRGGERVVVVGDGVNDGPFLRAGDVSIAMGSGCDLSRLGADAVLLRDDLALLPRAIDCARGARRIMRQNFAWAIGYNLVALPLAVSGQLSPWLAALGMSASSLVVVLNALRLRRMPEAA